MGSNSIRPRPAPFGLQAFDGYKMDALNGVIESVPQWRTLLDNLNSQIALRQFELAELDDYRPPTRSLKPKGSTESLLRPKESDNDPLPDDENENMTGAQYDSSDPPPLSRDTSFPYPATPTKPLVNTSKDSPPHTYHHSSSPGMAPLQRRPSGRLNSPNFPPKATLPTVLRKRKTESVASGGSQAPKYRTRSMIIVYYDSAVQIAFEELVKLISASRNAMRKGKMAARMAEMKKMAELETDTDSEDDALPEPKDMPISNGHTATSTPVVPTTQGLEADEGDNRGPRLEFVSTRRMGPSRDSNLAALRVNGNSHILGVGRMALFPSHRTNIGLSTPDSFSSIFDELDSGLEWCQSMCEHAAHQFLRDGNCNTEIAGIKRRLWEVKEIAEREAVKTAAEEKKKEAEEKPVSKSTNGTETSQESRGLKPIQMRKPFTAIKSIESDQIEVDDEGYNDVLPTLQWKSAAERVP